MSGLRGPYHTYPNEAAESAGTSETEYVIVSAMEPSLPTITADTAAVALGEWLHEKGWTGYRCGVLVTTPDPFLHTTAVLWSGEAAEMVYIVPRAVLEGSDA